MLGRFTIRSRVSGGKDAKAWKVVQISSGPSSKSRRRGMSSLTGSVYRLALRTDGGPNGRRSKEIPDRRTSLCRPGGLARQISGCRLHSADDLAAIFGLHPFTVSLLERAAGARSAVDRAKVERLIRQRAGYLGHRLPPVIKWLPGPQAAFDHLSRHGLTRPLADGECRLLAAIGLSGDGRGDPRSLVRDQPARE